MPKTVHHFGILCPYALGHLNPMCNLGYELQQRGHSVTVFGLPGTQAVAARFGLSGYEIGTDQYSPEKLDRMAAEMSQLVGLAGTRFFVSNVCEAASVIFRDLPDAVQDAGVGALLIDQVSLAGSTVADYLGLPFVTVCNSLPMNLEVGVPPSFTCWDYQDTPLAKLRNYLGYQFQDYLASPVYERIAEQRQQWGLWAYTSHEDAYSKLAQISQLPKALDFPRKKLPQWFHYLGPFRNSSSIKIVSFDEENQIVEALDDTPLIYANLSTLQNRSLEIFHIIAEACLETEAQLVISLGNPNANPSDIDLPGAPLVLRFPPHEKLIERSQLVITHAGSTALLCMQAGVPIVAIPITTDHFGMAARIARVGAGEVIPLRKLTVPKLRAAIKEVLKEEKYRRSAKHLSNLMSRLPATQRAGDIIERAVTARAPVLAVDDKSGAPIGGNFLTG